MSDSLITRLSRASRPYKAFDFVGEDGAIEHLYTRRLSSLEADKLREVFQAEFEVITREMEEGNLDTALIRRNLARLKKEKLAELVTTADQSDFLAEASNELDDKPWSDPKVKELAAKKTQEAIEELMTHSDEEVLEQALERRAFIVASLKATDTQNIHFLYYAVYERPEERAFSSAEEIGDNLSRDTISRLIDAVYTAQRGVETIDPLPTPPSKPSKRRSQSAKHSGAALVNS